MATKAPKPQEIQIKLLMVGESAVGKTCILQQYAEGTFDTHFITTIGIDYKLKHIELEGRKVRLQMWDTAGQEKFRTITISYFRGAQGIVLVYDVTNRKSFKRIEHWMEQIEDNADKDVDKILVGNKCDLVNDRVVSVEEGENLAKQYGVPFIETSAKEAIGVTECFEKIASIVFERIQKHPRAQKKTIRIGETGNTPSSCSC